MHGRLKVRTTEEERERKKKEQLLKVKAYKAAMAKIQAKRQRQELDAELMQLTAQVLQRNPDVATLWNIRRECILQRHAIAAEQTDVEQLQALHDAELAFTEQCLMVNPKSYCGWHQRCWSLEHCPNANWQRELQLCNKYLKLDERNFHTWDYRRYVVQKALVPAEEELLFCTEKIKKNFSNYSSWTYRSQLLPKLHPYAVEKEQQQQIQQCAWPMSEEKLKEELEMVLTAAFTDPNDSSAWFYQRWLLGYSRAELDLCVFRCDAQKAVLALTKPIDSNNIAVRILDANGECVLQLNDWRTSNKALADNLWLMQLSTAQTECLASNSNYSLQVCLPNLPLTTLPLTQHSCRSLYYFKPPNRSNVFSSDVTAVLQTQLNNCLELLEYEPDSKWTLLTSALLMRAIDQTQYHQQSLANLCKLQQVDYLREGYYKDLASKWILEKLLNDWSSSNDMPKCLDLKSETQLTSLPYKQYLIVADELLLSEQLQQRYAAELLSFGSLVLE